MATSDLSFDIPAGEILAKYINVDRMNKRKDERLETLANELNPEAAAQLIADGQKFVTVVEGKGNSVKARNQITESYLITYLADHDVPKSGGDNGTAHNVDGSTYKSLVPPELQGEELESLMLPIIDVIEEMNNLNRITLPEEVAVAKPQAAEEIKNLIAEKVKPYFVQRVQQIFGGDAS